MRDSVWVGSISEENGVPKRSELEPGAGLAERNGYAAESRTTDGLTLELFSILSRCIQPLMPLSVLESSSCY